MIDHVLTGFGFGPIQGGLFAKEAFESGAFRRIVVAEIDRALVDAVRAAGGAYCVNVARADGIEVHRIENVEMLNPLDARDRAALAAALAESTEIVTSLPSVQFYDKDPTSGVAALIADGLAQSRSLATIVYAAENNNHAAEILEQAVAGRRAIHSDRVQFLNTVIGKMSRVVADPREIADLGLRTIAPGIDRAFLVEQFNRILVTQTKLEGFRPGIEVFIEKPDLMPFEEAKLYGHNAIHALLGFVAALKGYSKMTELAGDPAVMKFGREAFLRESGGALIRKYTDLGDDLFTESGYRAYAEDLLVRMTNPYLGDAVERVMRDIIRKMDVDGRIFGTMRLALEQGVEPRGMAVGGLAAVAILGRDADACRMPESLRFDNWRTLGPSLIERILRWVWGEDGGDRAFRFAAMLADAHAALVRLVER